MKIRIKFRKWGVMKFVGHLDMMRYFQKAMRRAGIDIAYSSGFSPHQIMSFASPLGLGLTSDGEYMDIQVYTTKTSRQSVEALNGTMVDGVEVVSYRLLPEDAKNAMSIVSAADYRVSFAEESGMPDLETAVAALLANEEILITKKTKKSEAVIDLRPMIYQIRAEGNVLFMQLAAGSAENIKPNHVLEAMKVYSEALSDVLSEMPYTVQIHRMEVYADGGTAEEPAKIPLEDLGEEIV